MKRLLTFLPLLSLCTAFATPGGRSGIAASEAPEPVARADAAAALTALFSERDEATLRRNPVSALVRGDMRYAGEFGDYVSPAFFQAARRAAAAQPAPAPIRLQLTDSARARSVPVLVYGRTGARRPLVIISHGYGGEPQAYSFIAGALVRRGYVVAAIDHELPGDPEIPTGGNAYQLRMPNWRVGAASIGFTIRTLRQRRLAGLQPVVLIGHSNGGDMAMLFATEQPRLVRAAISLDNRRHLLPRTRRPRICSIRSSDQPADQVVLPRPAEQQRLGMRISTVPGLIHNDMWNGASPAQREAMLGHILACLD